MSVTNIADNFMTNVIQNIVPKLAEHFGFNADDAMVVLQQSDGGGAVAGGGGLEDMPEANIASLTLVSDRSKTTVEKMAYCVAQYLLDLEPKWQRKNVHSMPWKKHLIRAFKDGEFIGYFTFIDEKFGSAQKECLDAGHRTRTLLGFMHNEFAVGVLDGNGREIKKRFFRDWSPEEQRDFKKREITAEIIPLKSGQGLACKISKFYQINNTTKLSDGWHLHALGCSTEIYGVHFAEQFYTTPLGKEMDINKLFPEDSPDEIAEAARIIQETRRAYANTYIPDEKLKELCQSELQQICNNHGIPITKPGKKPGKKTKVTVPVLKEGIEANPAAKQESMNVKREKCNLMRQKKQRGELCVATSLTMASFHNDISAITKSYAVLDKRGLTDSITLPCALNHCKDMKKYLEFINKIKSWNLAKGSKKTYTFAIGSDGYHPIGKSGPIWAAIILARLKEEEKVGDPKNDGEEKRRDHAKKLLADGFRRTLKFFEKFKILPEKPPPGATPEQKKELKKEKKSQKNLIRDLEECGGLANNITEEKLTAILKFMCEHSE